MEKSYTQYKILVIILLDRLEYYYYIGDPDPSKNNFIPNINDIFNSHDTDTS